jgi:uncharacterized protein YbaR (Trm112 family)
VVANISRALDLMARDDPPMACCPGCRNHPLVSTFSRPGYEFHCTKCHSWFGWLDPVPVTTTAELDALQRQLQDQYQEEPCH